MFMKNHQSSHDELIAHLLTFMEMPGDFPDLLRPALSSEIEYHKETIINHPSTVADLAFWPVRGYTRVYKSLKPEPDREHYVQQTIDISLPGKVSLAANSFMNRVPVGNYFVIQKGSIMINFSYQSFMDLGAKMPEVKDLALKIVAAGEADWHDKMEMCKVKCADGYAKFLDHFDPVVEEFVDQRHIASYIGMASEELSRLKKSMRQKT